MSELSDLNGRSLEYLLANSISQLSSSSLFTEQAKKFNDKDERRLNNLDVELRQNFNDAILAFLNSWLSINFPLVLSSDYLLIDRLTDTNTDSVADIVLNFHPTNLNQTLKLSIKHNHVAARSQRPRPTPIHCGYLESSDQYKTFEQSIKMISKDFMETNIDVNSFSKSSNKYSCLYVPICNIVKDFLLKLDETHLKYYFCYLFGGNDYYKIIFNTLRKSVKIIDYTFSEFDEPKALDVTTDKNYVFLFFDNGIKFQMRLHNGSSRLPKKISSIPSLKFDTTIIDYSPKVKTISY